MEINDKIVPPITLYNMMKTDNNDTWDNIIKDWSLDKFDFYEQKYPCCDCNDKSHLIKIKNDDKHMYICKKCLDTFYNLRDIYNNIDSIVNAIIQNRHYMIYDTLSEYLSLDKKTVNSYNKKRKGLKIYKILDDIGQYHHVYNDYKKKLNKLYAKLLRPVSKEELLDRYNNGKKKFNICDKCKSCLEMCYECFYKNNSNIKGITKEQKQALWNLYLNIFGGKNIQCALYGSAGTGKTTLLKYIIQIANINELFYVRDYNKIFGQNDIEKIMEENSGNKKFWGLLVDLINPEISIVLASPTNKALDVIREKIGDIDGFKLVENSVGYYGEHVKLLFYTISKLLDYKRFLDKDHKMIFRRARKHINVIDRYNLIIIDESSMINKENVDDIKMDIEKHEIILENYYKGYIIFTGDKAQLPPVKETFSVIFTMEMNTIELKNIIRTEKEKIKELSNFIREWLFNDIKNLRHKLLSHKCNYITYYTKKNDFIEKYSREINSVILVWTNKTRNEYNEIVRKILFGKVTKEKYMIGEHLIFNNFYRLKIKNDEKIFYSSMPIIITDIKNDIYICEKYEYKYVSEKILEKVKKEKDIIFELDDRIEKYVEGFIYKFNNSMDFVFKILKIYFSYKGVIEEFPMNVIYDKLKYNRSIENGKKYIRDYFNANSGKLDNNINEFIREIIIEIFDMYYEQPFADVDYGYSMTVDKSQGSTFESVYIDSPDILDGSRYPFLDINVAKRRFYTGITRTSEKLSILI